MHRHYTAAQRAELVDLVTSGRASVRQAAAHLLVSDAIFEVIYQGVAMSPARATPRSLIASAVRACSGRSASRIAVSPAADPPSLRVPSAPPRIPEDEPLFSLDG